MHIDKLNVGMLQTNCYIIADDNKTNAAVIDPGGSSDEILHFIASKAYEVKYIIITHSHIDHIQAADDIKRTTGAQIIISTTDGATFNNSEYTLASILGSVAPSSRPDICVNQDDTMMIAGEKAKFIMTPGHTPGSMCIYFEDSNTLFSGDTLFYESIGRTDFPGGSYANIASSIKNKLYTLPDNTKVYPGHNSATTIIHEKESNFYI